MSYDDPNSVRREEIRAWTTAGNATISSKILIFQKQRLIAAHAKVDVAGTSTGNLVNVVNISGTTTTTVASLVLSTNTAGVQVDSTGLGFTCNAGDILQIVNGTDATGRALITIEAQQTPDAVRSPY